jgi:nucleotide-binding universal stress UspA family protein
VKGWWSIEPTRSAAAPRSGRESFQIDIWAGERSDRDHPFGICVTASAVDRENGDTNTGALSPAGGVVHDGGVSVAIAAERIAIPVAFDRTPDATTRCAVTFARRSGMGIEFVAAATAARRGRVEALLRHRCEDAANVGAAQVAWRLLDGDAADLDSYLAWSGACLQCVGTHAQVARMIGAGTVPMLVVGRACRPCRDGYRRLVVGLDGASGCSERIAAIAATFADRLDAELTLLEVVTPGRTTVDVPATAHVYWVANGLPRPPELFDTVAAQQPALGLGRFLDPDTVVVVGAPSRRRRLLGGVGGRLVRRAPCPVLVVPTAATTPGTCRTAAGRRSRSPAGTTRPAAPMFHG